MSSVSQSLDSSDLYSDTVPVVVPTEYRWSGMLTSVYQSTLLTRRRMSGTCKLLGLKRFKLNQLVSLPRYIGYRDNHGLTSAQLATSVGQPNLYLAKWVKGPTFHEVMSGDTSIARLTLTLLSRRLPLFNVIVSYDSSWVLKMVSFRTPVLQLGQLVCCKTCYLQLACLDNTLLSIPLTPAVIVDDFFTSWSIALAYDGIQQCGVYIVVFFRQNGTYCQVPIVPM